MKTYEKRKKKFVLNNSYFKNRHPESPADPFEVLEYYNQHFELPYENGKINDDWFYECFCEYQKRAGVQNSQFFTPTKTAERMVDIILDFGVDYNTRILDACCGFGQITKVLKKEKFEQISAFDNDKQMADACYDLTGVNARVFDFTNEEEYFSDQFNFIVSNPPYETKLLTSFLEFIYEYLYVNGKAVLLIPKGFLDKRRPEKLVRILNKFAIESREQMEENFLRTKTTAEIVVLKKI